MADRARYAANSDGRTERRAAESSEQRETRLARRCVAIIIEVQLCNVFSDIVYS